MMPTTNRRLAALGLAAMVALLSGLVVGLVSPVQRFQVAPAVLGAVGGLAASAAVFALLLGGDRRQAGTAPRPPQRTAALAPAGAQVAVADRAALIEACIYVRDRTTSPALADRLGGALCEAGVRVVEPAGARFDPARHEAGGSAPSGDPARAGTIAAVEVPGYADRDGRLLRVPVVTVYRRATATDRGGR